MTEIVIGTLLMIGLVMGLSLMVSVARHLLVPARPVEITVNGRTTISAVTGQKLLDALRSGGLPVPSGCAGAGTCGLCKVQVEGAGPALATETATLGRSAIAQGERLACQVVLRTPLGVWVHDDILAAETYICQVVSNRALAPLVKELVVALPPDAAFDFVAGEYAQVTAPPYQLDFAKIDVAPYQALWEKRGLTALRAGSERPVRRAYSIANRPEDAGRIVFNIRLALPPPGRPDVPPGIVSSHLFGLAPGDKLEVAGPYGDFNVRPGDGEIVLIGGGVGMAPLRAIVHDQLKAQSSTRRISFFYGARSRSDLFYDEEFQALAAAHPNFTWTVALSDPGPDEDWTGATGFIHEVALNAYLASHPAPESCDYYLCGPPMMMRAVIAMLDDLGVDPDSVFFDDFAS